MKELNLLQHTRLLIFGMNKKFMIYTDKDIETPYEHKYLVKRENRIKIYEGCTHNDNLDNELEG